MNIHKGFVADKDGPGASLLKRKRRPRQSKGEGLNKFAIERLEARRSNSRDQDRHHLHGAKFPVTYRGRKREVDVANLSGGGAMIACPFEPDLCERIDLHLGDGAALECLVRWVKHGRIGLEFAHETQLHCPDDEQAALLRRVIECAFPVEAYDERPAANEKADQRSHDRHPLIWSGELLYGPSSWNVRLRNVSPTGALIECEKSPREGAEVILDLGKAGSVTATVSWTVGDHCGLRFDEPFDMLHLAKSKPRVAPPTWLRPAYLENEVTAESAWDEAWNRMSVEDLRAELEGFLKR
jgi:hypothetical protein